MPEFKSRLVACGHLEDRRGIRADSPTCDVEGLNLVCSMAASDSLRIRCSDLKNAYFNGEPLDRVLLLGPPRGGLPGEDTSEKYAIASNLPVYGTGDAGRRFYKAFRAEAIKSGLTECKLMRSLYAFSRDGKIEVLLAAHVDDLLYVSTPEFQHLVGDLLQKFEVKETQEGNFRFCGRDYTQLDDFSVKITCKDTTEKVLPINYHQGNRSLDDKATAGEISQLRSVNGSLAWIARQCRPEMLYVCSKLQQIATIAQVKHLETCNRVLQQMVATSSRGLFFKAGEFRFSDAILISISDASWANDEKIVITDMETHKRFPRRSQFGRITLLGDPKLWSANQGYVHFLGFKSGLIKRTCRSTFRAETHGMLYSTETGDYIRAVVACLKNQLTTKTKDWESVAQTLLPSVWLTDCASLHDYLVNPAAASCEDKRLEIDLQSLRESLWENPDGSLKDSITEAQHDKPRWIDTSAMIADPLTKFGNEHFAQRLVSTMETGWLDLDATVNSQLRKMRQQKLRMARIVNDDRPTAVNLDASEREVESHEC